MRKLNIIYFKIYYISILLLNSLNEKTLDKKINLSITHFHFLNHEFSPVLTWGFCCFFLCSHGSKNPIPVISSESNSLE